MRKNYSEEYQKNIMRNPSPNDNEKKEYSYMFDHSDKFEK